MNQISENIKELKCKQGRVVMEFALDYFLGIKGNGPIAVQTECCDILDTLMSLVHQLDRSYVENLIQWGPNLYDTINRCH